MESYGLNDVERVLRLSRSTIRRLIARGFVSPTRGPRREYRFSFQDLIILRAARALSLANVPARRIGSSLAALRRRLPEDVPLAGLSICAVGDQVVVRKGADRWHAESGQYLLELDVRVTDGSLEIIHLKTPHAPDAYVRGDARACNGAARTESRAESRADGDVLDATDPEVLFEQALAMEERDAAKALRVYERCCVLDAAHLGAQTNRARLLHEAKRHKDAERAYREALRSCERDATLLFNYGVLLEDMSRDDEAIEAYLHTVTEDPDFADAHFNLARLYELRGQQQHAIRHLGVYRRLTKADPH